MRDVWHAFLRLFFRLLYNEFAWSYDLVAWLVSLGQWKAWGRTPLAHVRGERVLELGHGPGHLLVALAQRGLTAVGLDLSPSMARQAKRRLRQFDVAVPLVQARAQVLPFREGVFDGVVATFPTDFIVHPQTLHEVKRVLGAHGQLIVTLAVRFTGDGPISCFLAWLYRVTGQNQLSPDAFIRWLKQAGLSSRVVWEEVNHATMMLIIAEKH